MNTWPSRCVAGRRNADHPLMSMADRMAENHIRRARAADKAEPTLSSRRARRSAVEEQKIAHSSVVPSSEEKQRLHIKVRTNSATTTVCMSKPGVRQSGQCARNSAKWLATARARCPLPQTPDSPLARLHWALGRSAHDAAVSSSPYQLLRRTPHEPKLCRRHDRLSVQLLQPRRRICSQLYGAPHAGRAFRALRRPFTRTSTIKTFRWSGRSRS